MIRCILLTIAALTLLACSKENTGKGILSFGIATEEISLHTAASTKAISEEEINKFIVEIPQAGIPTGYFGDIKGEKFAVIAGSYTATAYSCSEDAANGTADGADKYGCIRYAGEKDFTVAPNDVVNVVIPCKATNSKVSVQLKENFLKILKREATTVTIFANSGEDVRILEFGNFLLPSDNTAEPSEEKWAIAMQSSESSTDPGTAQYAFYPAGSVLYITIQTQKIGRPATEVLDFTIAEPITTTAACWHKIAIDANLSNAPTGISIQVGEITDVVENGFSIDNYNSGNLTEDI